MQKAVIKMIKKEGKNSYTLEELTLGHLMGIQEALLAVGRRSSAQEDMLEFLLRQDLEKQDQFLDSLHQSPGTKSARMLAGSPETSQDNGVSPSVLRRSFRLARALKRLPEILLIVSQGDAR